MENKLPTYRIKLKPDTKTPVYAVSLVDSPAIEVDWIKLSEEVKMQFAAAADKQMLYGPLLIPGKLIYRRDEESGQEYNIVFEKETIEEIVMRYNKSKVNDIFNINHSGVAVDAYLAENWLTRRPDASESYGFDLPEGTWFGGVKIENADFWMSEVRSENVKGFSVEIQCGIELMDFSKMELESYDDYPQAARDKAQRAIDYKEKNGSDCGTAVGWTRARQLANGEKISEETINRMSAFQRHAQYKDVPYDEGCGGIMWDAWGGDEGIAWAERKAAQLKKLSSEKEDTYNNQNNNKFMEVKTKNGVVVTIEGDLIEGTIARVGEELAPVGEHELEDGTKITVDEEGKIVKIEKIEAMETELETEIEETEIEPTKLALDPAEVMAAIQPALDEFRSLIAEIATRIDVLEQHEAEPEMIEDYSAQIEELKTQVEKLASAAGAPSLTTKNDNKEAKTKNEEKLLTKINFFSKIK
jgi:hypothetical protein